MYNWTNIKPSKLLARFILLANTRIVSAFIHRPIPAVTRASVASTWHSRTQSHFYSKNFHTSMHLRSAVVGEDMNMIDKGNKCEKQSSRIDCDGYKHNKSQILWEWATHNDESFHDFSTEEAEAIRSNLLKWYRENRRKLPWRGDAGPFDGSTAGIATSAKNKLKNGKKPKKRGRNANDNADIGGNRQKNITSFFAIKKEEGKNNNSTNDLPLSSKRMKREGTKSTTAAPSCSSKDSNGASPIITVTGYSVWVSEIMLQQTRVEAVIPYYLKWMKSFPTVEALADASEEEVNAHWAGLGFYRRARLLHKGAKFVVEELDGIVPDTVEGLLQVSGIGRYTASAISSIAYSKCVPVVDGNVCRVLARLTGIANHIKAPVFKDKLGWKLAEQIVKAGDGTCAGEVNQALMELGATYCAPSGSGVDENDPLVEFYMSTKIGKEICELLLRDDGSVNELLLSEFVSNATSVRENNSTHQCGLCEQGGISSILFQLSDDLVNAVSEQKNEKSPLLESIPMETAAAIGHSRFPTNPPKKAKREEILGVAVLSHSLGDDEKWFMVKRPSEGLLAGQWEFPACCIWSSAEEGKGASRKSKGKSQVKKTKTTIDVPTIKRNDRYNAILELLSEFRDEGSKEFTLKDVFHSNNTQQIVVNDNSAIEHIFSHVRWNMFCEHADVSSSLSEFVSDDDKIDVDRFVMGNGGECRWMSEVEMQQVGITSSVKKLLAEVKTCRQTKSRDNKRRKTR